MKVLFLIDTLEPGGAERSTLEIIRHMRGVDPHVCYLYPGSTLAPEYEAAGIRVTALELGGRYSFAKGVRRVQRLMEENRPDIIHATLFRADLVARIAGRRMGVPVINSFVNDSYGKARYSTLPLAARTKLRIVQLIDRMTAGMVSRFLSITSAIRDSNCAALGVPRDRVDVIYRGRDPDAYGRVSTARLVELRHELGLNTRQPVLLNAARLIERKGQAELIRSMPRVLRIDPEVRLLIAGEGSYRKHLEAIIEELGLGHAVQLLGYRRDVSDLLALSDVFVFPSHWEGQGGALVEALFSGLPIVASDTEVHRESVTHGITGRLFPVGDVQAMAEEILWVLGHPEERERYGVEARKDAEARFEIGQIAEQHKALYLRVLRSLDEPG